ncbi:MAG: ribonuclease III [Clostridia bacterium]|nr:ribonuclease III [Clostridia bacterium]
MENNDKNQFNPADAGGLALAYLGDSVIEVMVRRRLISTGIRDVGRLNRMALDFVRASAQSAAVERLLPLLDEEESAIFRRGRNAHTGSVPHSSSAVDYRRATGMEALFGYLFLTGNEKRLAELFDLCYPPEGDDNE